MGKFFQHICQVDYHKCAGCGKNIEKDKEEWEHKYYKDGHFFSEYYHPWCC